MTANEFLKSIGYADAHVISAEVAIISECAAIAITELNDECKRLHAVAEFWQQKYNEQFQGWKPPKIDNNPIA